MLSHPDAQSANFGTLSSFHHCALITVEGTRTRPRSVFAMKQIFYTRPYSTSHCRVVLGLLGMIGYFSIIVFGIQSMLTVMICLFYFIAQLGAVVLEPDICAFTTRTQQNHSKPKIRRPLVGFARCETQREYPDVINGQFIEWRPARINGRAIIRI